MRVVVHVVCCVLPCPSFPPPSPPTHSLADLTLASALVTLLVMIMMAYIGICMLSTPVRNCAHLAHRGTTSTETLVQEQEHAAKLAKRAQYDYMNTVYDV